MGKLSGEGRSIIIPTTLNSLLDENLYLPKMKKQKRDRNESCL